MTARAERRSSTDDGFARSAGGLRPRCLAVAAVLGGLLVGLGGAADGAGAPPLPDDPLAGRLLFESKGCLRCHGIGGSGPSIGPGLGEGHFGGSFLDLGASLWNHVPGMSVTLEAAGLPWPELDPDEITRLTAFLYFIDYLGRPGSARAGARVFESHGCSTCHDIEGFATGLGPDLGGLRRFASPLSVAQEIWNHGPSMLASMREANLSAPSFGEGDLADLSAFIRQSAEGTPQEPLLLAPGNPNRGGELFRSKGCSVCHGRDGRGGEEGPDLGEAGLRRSAEAIAGTMWNHALEMRESMLERGVGWPSFAESELADLVAYLYFLPFADSPGSPARGAEVFHTRSCADCHRSEGEPPHPGAESAVDLQGAPSTSGSAALVAAMWNHAPIMKRLILREGHAWPELTGTDLRDLRSFFQPQEQSR